MTDRPILMSAPMVRALLREVEQPGTGKTQTRRLGWKGDELRTREEFADDYAGSRFVVSRIGNGLISVKHPSIWQSVKPGDRLWVRETWGAWPHMGGGIQRDSLRFRADQPPPDDPHDAWQWRPSIHLPRRHSRITLLVTATKRERFHEISEEDARAEGFAEGQLDDGFDERPFGDTGMTISSPGTFCSAAGMAMVEFARLYPDPQWDAYSSPECVAITFRPVLANIDQVAEVANG